MVFPKFPKLNLALLEFLEDQTPHKMNEVANHLANHFKLTKEEIEMKKPSGRETLFHNRVHWAKFNLKLGGYIENIEKGTISITQKGHELLKTKPTEVTAEQCRHKIKKGFEF